MSRRLNVNTRARPSVDISTEGHYIFACHTSPSCITCFVASLTKIRLNSIKNLHFTGTEWYDHTVWQLCHVTQVKTRVHRGASANERVRLAVMHDGLVWHISMSHPKSMVTSMRCDIEICHMARDWIWTNKCHRNVIYTPNSCSLSLFRILSNKHCQNRTSLNSTCDAYPEH